jgi:hypothetical protein
MKLKSIVIKVLLTTQLLYVGINNGNTNKKPIANYFDRVNIEDTSDELSDAISQTQINNIKKKYFNKHNSDFEISPIEIFSSLLLENKKLDSRPWLHLIGDTAIQLNSILLKKNANWDSNDLYVLYAFIISVFAIDYSDLLTEISINTATKDFLQNIYDNISEKQKNIITNALSKNHKQRFKKQICFTYPQ